MRRRNLDTVYLVNACGGMLAFRQRKQAEDFVCKMVSAGHPESEIIKLKQSCLFDSEQRGDVYGA